MTRPPDVSLPGSQRPPRADAIGRAGCILVVDDDPDVLRATALMLADAGFEVLTGGTGAEAVELTRQHRPAVLLLDVVLPDGSGLDVARVLKSDPEMAGVFVILLSGQRTSSADQAQGLDEGLADGYIARPVGKHELLARLDAFLRIRAAQEALRAKNAELQDALAQIRTLSGLLPICAGCKRIRDDAGIWTQIEAYIHDRTDVEFSHGLCPECTGTYFPDHRARSRTSGEGSGG
jgi:CheY-like chemotaxis protein